MAMVPDEASCRIVNAFLVAEQIKSKMARECDLSQVNFIIKGFESAFHMLCAKLSPELEVVGAREIGLSMAHFRYNKAL